MATLFDILEGVLMTTEQQPSVFRLYFPETLPLSLINTKHYQKMAVQVRLALWLWASPELRVWCLQC